MATIAGEALTHTLGVVAKAVRLASDLSFRRPAREELIIAAWLHGIGKATLAQKSGIYQYDGYSFVLELSAGRPVPSWAAGAHDIELSQFFQSLSRKQQLGILFHSRAQDSAKFYSAEMSQFYADHAMTLTGLENSFIDLVTYCDITTLMTGKDGTLDAKLEELRRSRSAADPAIQGFIAALPQLSTLVWGIDHRLAYASQR